MSDEDLFQKVCNGWYCKKDCYEETKELLKIINKVKRDALKEVHKQSLPLLAEIDEFRKILINFGVWLEKELEGL